MEHYCHLETEVMALYSKKKWEQKNIFLDNLFKKLKMKNFCFKKCSNISMDFVAKLGHFYRILPPAPNLPPPGHKFLLCPILSPSSHHLSCPFLLWGEGPTTV